MNRDMTVSVSIIEVTLKHHQSPQTELDIVVSVNQSYIDNKIYIQLMYALSGYIFRICHTCISFLSIFAYLMNMIYSNCTINMLLAYVLETILHYIINVMLPALIQLYLNVTRQTQYILVLIKCNGQRFVDNLFYIEKISIYKTLS